MKRIYLSPAADEQYHADLQRLNNDPNVEALVLALQGQATVKSVVRKLSNQRCHTLLLPDDYHRHSQLIEYVKGCAHYMGMEVMPLSRYLLKHAPAPATAPVHADAVAQGAGHRIPAPAS